MRSCPLQIGRLLAAAGMVTAALGGILLFGRAGSESWRTLPGKSLLAGILFLGCAALLSLCAWAAGRERRWRTPVVRSIHELEMGPPRWSPAPFVSVPAGCVLLAALPGLAILVFLGLLFVANSITLAMSGLDIARWLFVPLR